MPQIKLYRIFIIIVLASICFACGDGTESGEVFVPESGHPSTWVNPSYIGTEEFHGQHVIVSDNAGEDSSLNEGSNLYSQNCAGCHGEDATGLIGPNIQGKTANEISSAITNVSIMQGLSSLTENEISVISTFLSNVDGSTGTTEVVIDASLCMECHGEDLKGGISKVSCYACHNGEAGTIGHGNSWLGNPADSVHFHGSYAKPYAIACTACHGAGLTGNVGPNCFRCHDGSEWNSF